MGLETGLQIARQKQQEAEVIEHKTPGIEIPQVIYAGLTKQVVDLMPDYIPIEVRTKLLEEHPDPRIFVSSKMEANTRKYIHPESIREEDRQDYDKGIGFLNELAVESLAIEIMIRENAEYESRSEVVSTYDKLFSNGMDDNFAGFLQHMHIALLTGDRTELDEYLKNNYNISGIDQFAIELGQRIRELEEQEKAQKKDKEFLVNITIGVRESGSQPRENEIQVNSLHLKLQAALLGMGVLLLPSTMLLANAFATSFNQTALEFMAKSMGGAIGGLIGSASLLSFAKSAKYMTQSLRGTIVHEMIHYLSFDKKNNRFGFYSNIYDV